jgi:DNA-binding transcriptional LysR family regulator
VLNIDINQLRTFIEIEKTRHFGKAAENLYLTQAAISARIKLMEGTLGVELFERHRNNIQLTKHGVKLLPYAIQMVEIWIRTIQEIKVPIDRNDLTIAAPASLWSSELQNLPNKLFQRFSDLQLVVHSFDSNIIVRKLLDRTIDVGFLYDQPKIDELALIKFMNFELSLFSNNKNISLEDVNKTNFISIDLGISFKQIQAKVLPNVASPILEAINWQMACDYILEFGGTFLYPSTLGLKTKGLYPIIDTPTVERTVYLSYSKAVSKKPNTQKYINALIQQFGLDSRS